MNQLDKAIFEISHEQISGKQVDCAAARVRQKLFGDVSAAPADGPQRLRSSLKVHLVAPHYIRDYIAATSAASKTTKGARI